MFIITYRAINLLLDMLISYSDGVGGIVVGVVAEKNGTEQNLCTWYVC